MKRFIPRLILLTAGAWLLAPMAAWAHEGHAGEHGWLAGAAQPLLSLDHFLAGLSVALVVATGLAFVARQRQPLGSRPES